MLGGSLGFGDLGPSFLRNSSHSAFVWANSPSVKSGSHARRKSTAESSRVGMGRRGSWSWFTSICDAFCWFRSLRACL